MWLSIADTAGIVYFQLQEYPGGIRMHDIMCIVSVYMVPYT